MRRWRRLAFASISITCMAVACSLEDGGTVGVESPPLDSSVADGIADGSGSDGSGGDSSTNDSGDAGDSGVDSGPPVTYLCVATPVTNCQTGCPSAPNNCAVTGACVADCTTCTNGVQLDVRYCNACFPDGGAALSVCAPSDPNAVAACLNGYSRCPCPSSVNDCPGPYQTCEATQCFECGEPDASNDGHGCKGGTGGKNCDTGGNVTDHLRCH